MIFSGRIGQTGFPVGLIPLLHYICFCKEKDKEKS